MIGKLQRVLSLNSTGFGWYGLKVVTTLNHKVADICQYVLKSEQNLWAFILRLSRANKIKCKWNELRPEAAAELVQMVRSLPRARRTHILGGTAREGEREKDVVFGRSPTKMFSIPMNHILKSPLKTNWELKTWRFTQCAGIRIPSLICSLRLTPGKHGRGLARNKTI